MQPVSKQPEPEVFLNSLLRSYIITWLPKVFELKPKTNLKFIQKDKYNWGLEVQDIKLLPFFFYEHFLSVELRYSSIDFLSIEINDANFLDTKVVIRGIYLDLKLFDFKLDEVQERLRWIGVMFEAISN
jgi:hypothetical protein